MFSSVIRFMCGQRLHGLTNSTFGVSAATFEAIEHSVTSTTRGGSVLLDIVDHARDVEPVKSAAAMTSGGHSGWAMILMRRVRRAIGLQLFAGEALMDFTTPLPGDDLDVGLGLDILGQILIRDEQDARHAKAFDNLNGVCGRAADVGLGLHFGAGVDVSDDRHAWDRPRGARGHRRR